MKKTILTVFMMLSVGFVLRVGASNQPNVHIVELQTGGKESASAEFAEIYNHNVAKQSLNGWKLQYRSAFGSSWSTKAELNGEVGPRSRYLIASDELNLDERDAPSSPGFSTAAGHVRIIDNQEIVRSEISWGENDKYENSQEAPGKGQSLKLLVDEDGFFDTGNLTYFVSEAPSPTSETLLMVEEETPNPNDNKNEDTDASEQLPAVRPKGETRQQQTTYKVVQITELFIDPQKPLTDAENEFVEIHNPHKSAINLKDYKIKTGNKLNYSYTLPNAEIKPGQYIALASKDTGLTLSNSGGKAVLLSPEGDILFETKVYAKAEAGKSWSLVSDDWTWTDPTPSSANVAVKNVEGESADNDGASAADEEEQGSLKGVTALTAQSSDDRARYDEPEAAKSEQLNTTVLAGVGGLAILYMLYEYRQDIGFGIRKLGRYAAKSRQHWQNIKGRRSN